MHTLCGELPDFPKSVLVCGGKGLCFFQRVKTTRLRATKMHLIREHLLKKSHAYLGDSLSQGTSADDDFVASDARQRPHPIGSPVKPLASLQSTWT